MQCNSTCHLFVFVGDYNDNCQDHVKWFQFYQRALHWQDIQRSSRSVRVDLARERSISILQKRYGYDRDKAISELDRYYSKAYLG